MMNTGSQCSCSVPRVTSSLMSSSKWRLLTGGKKTIQGLQRSKASCSRDTQFILSQRSLEDEVSLRKKHSSSSSTKSQDKKVSRHQLLSFLGSKTCPDFTWQPALLYLMCVFLGRCKNSVLSALKTYGASAVRQVPA